MKFVLFLFGDGDADVLAGDVLSGDVLSGDVLSGDVLSGDVLAGDVLSGDFLAVAVGGGLGGHVGGTEYLPPRRLCLVMSS